MQSQGDFSAPSNSFDDTSKPTLWTFKSIGFNVLMLGFSPSSSVRH
jgi:hypothetical protein